jgi:hypothetical protein
MLSPRLSLLVALLATLLMTSGAALAAPVHGDPLDFIQPDGTVVTVSRKAS